MRGTEWPPIGERAAFDNAGGRSHHGNFEGARPAPAAAEWTAVAPPASICRRRRSDHQQVMTTGGGHLECALGGFLALDVGKVEERAFGFEDFGLRPRQHLRAVEVIGELDQRGCRDNLDIPARPTGFRSANRRADQTLAAGIGAVGGGQHAGNRGNRTVEAEFAQDRTKPDKASCGMAPMAAIRPSAIGRSQWLPSLGRSAGARLMVMRRRQSEP